MSSEGERATTTTVAPTSAAVTRALGLYFLKLGAIGFGGPIALAASMQRDLVEERGLISPAEYKEGLAFAQLSPGPLAAQLAMYLGWLRGGAAGAALSGIAFVAPSFAMVLAIAKLYVVYGSLSWMQGAFYGVGAAVIGILARGVVKLAKTTNAKDPLLWVVSLICAGVTAVTESEKVWLILLAGLVVMLVKAPPRFSGGKGAALVLPFVTGLHGAATPETLGDLAWYFTKAGAFVFGSGLAIVPFLYEGVVQRFHWLDERQFVDAVAVAMITPGPVVITSGFIGFLAAGPVGALIAATATFLPPFLLVITLARFVRRARENASLRAAIAGITAAAAGAIAGAGVVLGRRAVHDPLTLALALGTLLVLTRSKKIPEPVLIVFAGAIGVTAKRFF